MITPAQNASAIRWFAEISIEDIPHVGGKNASLGEMYRELAREGVKVPNGFAITAEAYRTFLQEAKLDDQIKDILKGLNTHDLTNLRERGLKIRHAILAAPFPSDLEQAIMEFLRPLGRRHSRTIGCGRPE